jgi:hypothetical protein
VCHIDGGPLTEYTKDTAGTMSSRSTTATGNGTTTIQRASGDIKVEKGQDTQPSSLRFVEAHPDDDIFRDTKLLDKKEKNKKKKKKKSHKKKSEQRKTKKKSKKNKDEQGEESFPHSSNSLTHSGSSSPTKEDDCDIVDSCVCAGAGNGTAVHVSSRQTGDDDIELCHQSLSRIEENDESCLKEAQSDVDNQQYDSDGSVVYDV